MNWTLAAMTFVISWCIALFVVLPIGVSAPQQNDPLHASGAPKEARIGRKMCWSAGIAAVVTFLFVLIRNHHWVHFS